MTACRAVIPLCLLAAACSPAEERSVREAPIRVIAGTASTAPAIRPVAPVAMAAVQTETGQQVGAVDRTQVDTEVQTASVEKQRDPYRLNYATADE